VLLAGTKTQTRRLKGLEELNEVPAAWTLVDQETCAGVGVFDFQKKNAMATCRAPWSPGDHIYAKETWRPCGCMACDLSGEKHPVIYRAGSDLAGPWKSPLFMRRADSRIRRRISAVRCQRLQDITEADAKAEGVVDGLLFYACSLDGIPHTTAKLAYQEIWDSINGLSSWDRNPWVFAYTLEEIK